MKLSKYLKENLIKNISIKGNAQVNIIGTKITPLNWEMEK